MSVISNTTVPANFAAADSLASLKDLFGEVFLSTDVYQEIQRGLEEGYSFYSGIEEVLHPLQDGGWLRLISLSMTPLTPWKIPTKRRTAPAVRSAAPTRPWKPLPALPVG